MAQLTTESVKSEISRRIGKTYGIKNNSLPKLLARLKGRLPHGFEKELTYLFDAEDRIRHPKRRGQVNQAKLEEVRRLSFAQLEQVDIVRDRTRARSLWLAEFAARMLLFAVGLLGLLLWYDVI